MKLMQYMAMVAKASATVTLNKLDAVASRFSPVPPDAAPHPVYLGNDKIVITTTSATADPTFWGCPGYFRVIFERIT